MNAPLKQEILDRMNHFYRQTDGSFIFPNSAEGDLLKMAFRLISDAGREGETPRPSLIEAARAIDFDATVIGLAGATNHPAVKCEVQGLCLRHFYDLRNALEFEPTGNP